MKRVIFLILITVSTYTAFASSSNDIQQVREVKAEIKNRVQDIKGVNGIGITTCSVEDGAPINIDNTTTDYLFCVVVDAKSESTYDQLLARFPLGSQVDGTYVVLSINGEIRQEERSAQMRIEIDVTKP